MGGDPFAVLKRQTQSPWIDIIYSRMGGDPFAVLKPNSVIAYAEATVAAWGETLLRY